MCKKKRTKKAKDDNKKVCVCVGGVFVLFLFFASVGDIFRNCTATTELVFGRLFESLQKCNYNDISCGEDHSLLDSRDLASCFDEIKRCVAPAVIYM